MSGGLDGADFVFVLESVSSSQAVCARVNQSLDYLPFSTNWDSLARRTRYPVEWNVTDWQKGRATSSQQYRCSRRKQSAMPTRLFRKDRWSRMDSPP